MIQLKFNAVTTEDDEDQCLCNTYNYDVMWSEEGDDVIKIGQGTIMLYLFSRTHHEKYISIEDVFYENYHTEIYKTLFEDGSMKDEFMFDIMDSNGNLNVLVPDRLEIFDGYRNKGYGKVVTELRRRFFSGCYGIEILKAFPLQLEVAITNDELMNYAEMEHDEKKATDSLYKMYKKHGYKRVKRTNLFYNIPD